LREGLHQAVEAKEGVPVTAEKQPIARISRQRFFKLYRGVCGMTGTASGSEKEFREIYARRVARIPTRLAPRRLDLPTRYFATESAKFQAVCADVEKLQLAGRPILVGTRTIDASERLATLLRARGLEVRLLNGTQDEDEARIVARAGECTSITIATNMAGRGTDIKLGPGVAALGGLHVIGTERHESARVDRQLIGRAARQGDPGSSQFFVSAEDSLIIRFAPWLQDTMKKIAGPAGEIESDLSREVASVQKAAEQQAYSRRRQVFAYDQWQEKVLDRLASETPSDRLGI
jgi:preprotein translocase subunit SecA